MKNFTLLVASAAVAVTASAAVNPALRRQAPEPIVKAVPAMMQSQAAPMKVATVAEAANFAAPRSFVPTTVTTSGAYAFFGDPTDFLYVGLTPEGAGYGISQAIGGYKGVATFNNYSAGAEDCAWNYGKYFETLKYEKIEDAPTYNVYTTDLTVDRVPGDGIYPTPKLTIIDANDDTEEYANQNIYIGFGANAAWFMSDEAEECGLCTYPRRDYKSPDGYTASTFGYMAYAKGQTNFDEAGLMDRGDGKNSWTYHLNRWGYTNAHDLKFEGFTMSFPAPVSPYIISTLWSWISTTATAETELECYIYEIEDGVIADEPIAKGTATVAAGNSNFIVFDLVAVDEDGDETAKTIAVNKAIAIEIPANDNITAMMPVFGNGTEVSEAIFNAVGLTTVYPQHTGIMISGVDDEGEFYGNFSCPAYYLGTTDDDYCYPCDTYTMVDAVFPWAIPAEGSSFTVNAPVDGVEGATVEVETMFNLGLLLSDEYQEMEVSCDYDWIQFNVGDFNSSNGVTPITIDVEAYPNATTQRVGFINFRGYGQDFDIVVVQGAELGINSIEAAPAAAEYFDLQGRRLNAAPAAGLYFERRGTTTTKVVK